ncbi:MAG: GHKL domain-containing protein [Bacilli bacterium]|nr:GHKL domain-containing protein [Bacilli bacterium]
MNFGEALEIFFVRFLNVSVIFQLMVFAFAATCLTSTFKKDRKSILIHAAYFLGVFIASFGMFMLGFCLSFVYQTPRGYSSAIIAFFMLLPGAIFLGIFSKGNVWHRILRITFFISLCYLSTEIAHNYNLLLEAPLAEQKVLRDFLFCVPFLPIPPIAIFTGRFKTHHIQRFHVTLTIMSAFLFLATLVIAFTSSRFQAQEVGEGILLILAMALLTAVDVWGYGVHYLINKSERKALELEARTQLGEASYLMVRLNEEQNERLTLARHDLKNTFAFLREAILEGRNDEALSFIDEAAGKAFGDIQIVDCGNSVVSSVMTLELKKAKLSAVEVKYRLIVPKRLGITDYDLCTLMSNIIDNAIEGTSMAKKAGKEGYVDFSILARDSILRIQCKNPTCLKAVPTLSTKTERGHGYGISIIKYVVKQHDGYAQFAVEDGMFVLDCLLNLAPLEENDA